MTIIDVDLTAHRAALPSGWIITGLAALAWMVVAVGAWGVLALITA